MFAQVVALSDVAWPFALPYLLHILGTWVLRHGCVRHEVYVGNLDLAVRDVDLMKTFSQRYSSVGSAKALALLVPGLSLYVVVGVVWR